MSLPVIIYLAGVSEAINVVAFFLIAACGIVIFTLVMCTDDSEPLPTRELNRLACVMLASTLILVFAPSKTTVYAMLAAHGVEFIALNEDVQRIAPKSLEYLERQLDKALTEAHQ